MFFEKMQTRKNDGFTLVELIVVIAILAILAGIGVPAYSGYIEKANVAADEQLLHAVNIAFLSAAAEHAGGNITAAKLDEVTTAIFIITCIATNAVIPMAIKLPNISGAFIAINTLLQIKIPNKTNTSAQPTNPSSSPNIENIKSLCGSGIYKYFCLLSPNPVPNSPPEPIAYKL